MLNNLRHAYNRLTGRFNVPPELLQSRETKVLHISDTPTTLYPAIKSLLEVIRPDVLVHTGDLADDIKLESNPGFRRAYGRAVIPFLNMLEDSPACDIYVVPGNHDCPEVVGGHVGRSRLVEEGDVLSIKGVSLGMAHTLSGLPDVKGYGLYGHNFSRGSREGVVYLNGLKTVNVILCPSGRVEKIYYPLSVNNDRKMDNCYGLTRTL